MTDLPIDRDLVARWLDRHSRKATAEGLDILKGAQSSAPPFGLHEGRVDLRGLTLAPTDPVTSGFLAEAGPPDRLIAHLTRFAPSLDVSGRTLSNVDLTGARLAGVRLRDVTLKDVVLTGALCVDWRAWHATWESCDFRGAHLAESNLGIWWDNTNSKFVDCVFDDASMGLMNFDHTAFHRCTFRRTDFRETQFDTSTFEGCAMSARLDEAIFTRCALDEVDFSAAHFRWTEFRDTSLERTVPPEPASDQVVVADHAAVVRGALAVLDESEDRSLAKLRRRLNVELQHLSPNRGFGVWHVSEIGEDDERQRRARLLLEQVDAQTRKN